MEARAIALLLSLSPFFSPFHSSFHDKRYKNVIRTGLALNEMGGAEAIRAISAGGARAPWEQVLIPVVYTSIYHDAHGGPELQKGIHPARPHLYQASTTIPAPL